MLKPTNVIVYIDPRPTHPQENIRFAIEKKMVGKHISNMLFRWFFVGWVVALWIVTFDGFNTNNTINTIV